jgi:hypothetical protein
MSSRFLPALGVLAGGIVHSILPRGAFGGYDVAIRTAITAAVACATYLLAFTLSKRWGRSH